MLIENLKKNNIKAIIYILCSVISFYYFLKINGTHSSLFHKIWSFTFFSWSLAIISEIQFQDIFQLTKIIQDFQRNINFVIKFIMAELQLLSLLVIFFNDNIILLLMVLFLFSLFYYIKLLKKKNEAVYNQRYIKYLNLASLIGFLYVFFSLSFTGTIFIIFGLVINYFSINIYNSKVEILEYFKYREFYNFMQFISILILYRGGMEMPIYKIKIIY